MEYLPWAVAIGCTLVASGLLLRGGSGAYKAAVSRLSEAVAKPEQIKKAEPGDPVEVVRLRSELRRGWRPAGAVSGGASPDADARALGGLFRYVERAVLRPLEQELRRGRRSDDLQDAVDALRDLEFYARSTHEGDVSRVRENLPSVIQSVTREYALESGIAVRFAGPEGPLAALVAAEHFKDALYLLLANAGQFGRGSTIEVAVRPADDRVEIRIRDRGPGFTEEALKRAFEPFWSSESDALGLGLPRAKELLEAQGATVRIENREGGGADAVVSVPRPPSSGR